MAHSIPIELLLAMAYWTSLSILSIWHSFQKWFVLKEKLPYSLRTTTDNRTISYSYLICFLLSVIQHKFLNTYSMSTAFAAAAQICPGCYIRRDHTPYNAVLLTDVISGRNSERRTEFLLIINYSAIGQKQTVSRWLGQFSFYMISLLETS